MDASTTTTLSAFRDACDECNIPQIHQMLDDDNAITEEMLHQPDESRLQRTPLLLLLAYQRPAKDQAKLEALVRRLVQAGAAVNAQDAEGKTALHYVSGQLPTGDYSRRNPALAKILIEEGADVHMRDYYKINTDIVGHGWTPLHEACCNWTDGEDRCIAAAKHLLEAGADPTATSTRHGDTPLHLCLWEYVHHDGVKSFCITWPKLAAFMITHSPTSVLEQAAQDGVKPMDCCDCLEKALLKDVDSDGVGATSGALGQRIQFLTHIVPALEGKDVSPFDRGVIGGKMLIHVMKWFNGDNDEDIWAEHIDPLLEFGADVNHVDDEKGMTALHYLLCNQDLDEELWCDDGGLDAFVTSIVDGLSQKAPGLDLRVTSKSGRSLLDCAQDAGYTLACARLQAKRAKLEDPTEE